jgi:hypothetical protein
MIAFRQADPRYPFLWESPLQPAGRWHGDGDGPAHYFADTPHGAWAELLRHEEIHDPADLGTIRRAIWAVDIGDDAGVRVRLPADVATGDRDSYPACRAHARRLRARGTTRVVAPSAALLDNGAHGVIVRDGERPGPARSGRVIVVFGPPASFVGWKVVEDGHPPVDVLGRVRHFRASSNQG